MQKLFIPVLLGSAREGRESEKAARFVYNEVVARGDIETEFIDVREHLFGNTIIPGAPQASAWQKIMARADGLIIVTPEYNHGYPGELKILLDSAKEEYIRKPVVLCGVSSGGFGGARVVDHLRVVLVQLKLVPLESSVMFSSVKKLFDAEGKMLDETYSKKVGDMTNELVWYARTLKAGREQK